MRYLHELISFAISDVNVEHPDKKSIMMYIMCYFQVLPHSTVAMDGTTTVTTVTKTTTVVSSEPSPPEPQQQQQQQEQLQQQQQLQLQQQQQQQIQQPQTSEVAYSIAV